MSRSTLSNICRLTLAAALFGIAPSGCTRKADAPPPPPPEVTVVRPTLREITEWDEFTGRCEAIESVEVRARVSGYLESVHFKDGQLVEKGDLLFIIDPRPYKAAVDRSQAEAERAGVQVEVAKSDFERAKRLIQTRAISEEEFDRRGKAVMQAEAAMRSAKAAQEEASLNLEFTQIRAPIAGRVSRHLVSQGNLIYGTIGQSTLLTTIVPYHPIHIYFDVDERTVLKYTRLNIAGERPTSRDVANPVQVALADEAEFTINGRMDFVENRLDPETATLRGRAIVDNPNGLLTPGLFARLRLKGKGPYQALLLTDEALGTDQAQKFALVVKEDSTVERRYVKTGKLYEGLRIINEGLRPEDRVITKGLQRARVGQPVTVAEARATTNGIAAAQEAK